MGGTETEDDMATPEPSKAALRQAHADQQAAQESRAGGAKQAWRDQGREIEDGMADAVERATAMGDLVEPTTLPPQRRAAQPAEDERPGAEEKPAG